MVVSVGILDGDDNATAFEDAVACVGKFCSKERIGSKEYQAEVGRGKNNNGKNNGAIL